MYPQSIPRRQVDEGEINVSTKHGRRQPRLRRAPLDSTSYSERSSRQVLRIRRFISRPRALRLTLVPRGRSGRRMEIASGLSFQLSHIYVVHHKQAKHWSGNDARPFPFVLSISAHCVHRMSLLSKSVQSMRYLHLYTHAYRSKSLAGKREREFFKSSMGQIERGWLKRPKWSYCWLLKIRYTALHVQRKRHAVKMTS